MPSDRAKERFHVVLIKPSRYDDDGYVVRWWRGVITSNSLACMHALTLDACENRGLGDLIEPVIHVYDETVQKVPVRKLAREFNRAGEKSIICMTGVQTNQFDRAVDLAREFKREGLKTMIGGFHVSGVIEMLPDLGCGLKEALDEGITLVAGEVENRWQELLRAAFEDRLEPLYNFVNDKPPLQTTPGPVLPEGTVDRFFGRQTSFDAGRGCPFHCSFCTIINIQGNTMRGRNADDIEKIVRHNYRRGYHHMFITDDNFARHPEWESIADRLIALKEKEKIHLSLMIQTDTAAHRIPGFIEKMTKAGVRRVFIGLESVNPDNLRASGKYQNQLNSFRVMLQKWRDNGAVTIAGYIIGFPGDTVASIARDVEFLKRELPLDLVEFFVMTPLPGSKDHQKLYLEKFPMSPDNNLYDTMHSVVEHPNMTQAELMTAYQEAWKSFLSREHCRTLLLRRKGPRRRILFSMLIWFRSSLFLDNMHPLMGGFLRRKGRKDRRPGLPVEPFLPYYAKRIFALAFYVTGLLGIIIELWLSKREADKPSSESYMDIAITPEPVKTLPPKASSPVTAAQASSGT